MNMCNKCQQVCNTVNDRNFPYFIMNGSVCIIVDFHIVERHLLICGRAIGEKDMYEDEGIKFYSEENCGIL